MKYGVLCYFVVILASVKGVQVVWPHAQQQKGLQAVIHY